MARDWRRTELLRACSTLVSEGLMDMSGLKVALGAYDERKELQDTLELVAKHEDSGDTVTLDEAYSSVMTGIPLAASPEEQDQQQ